MRNICNLFGSDLFVKFYGDNIGELTTKIKTCEDFEAFIRSCFLLDVNATKIEVAKNSILVRLQDVGSYESNYFLKLGKTYGIDVTFCKINKELDYFDKTIFENGEIKERISEQFCCRESINFFGVEQFLNQLIIERKCYNSFEEFKKMDYRVSLCLEHMNEYELKQMLENTKEKEKSGFIKAFNLKLASKLLSPFSGKN